MTASTSSKNSGFFTICILHSLISLISGSLIMFYLYEISVIGHGIETAQKLIGLKSSPGVQMVIQVSDSFVGLLLFGIGLLLFMVSFVKDAEFQRFFAKGCVFLHLIMALWRVYFERRIEYLAKDWPRQLVGDFVLALSWVFFLVFSWIEEYD